MEGLYNNDPPTSPPSDFEILTNATPAAKFGPTPKPNTLVFE